MEWDGDSVDVVPAGSDQIEGYRVAGSTSVWWDGGLSPRLSNQKQMEIKAQRMALHQARRKAAVAAAGKTLGEVVQCGIICLTKAIPCRRVRSQEDR